MFGKKKKKQKNKLQNDTTQPGSNYESATDSESTPISTTLDRHNSTVSNDVYSLDTPTSHYAFSPVISPALVPKQELVGSPSLEMQSGYGEGVGVGVSGPSGGASVPPSMSDKKIKELDERRKKFAEMKSKSLQLDESMKKFKDAAKKTK
ncbi:hypothetical protein HDU67_003451 [Dinochytrium kinnereticum]|nr:hypothetical protein HDU67_003451 [Dinochytrium kinnereticum]